MYSMKEISKYIMYILLQSFHFKRINIMAKNNAIYYLSTIYYLSICTCVVSGLLKSNGAWERLDCIALIACILHSSLYLSFCHVTLQFFSSKKLSLFSYPFDSGFGHVTCSGQWNVSTSAVCRCLKKFLLCLSLFFCFSVIAMRTCLASQ